jgi:serine/threonine protein kinase
LCRAQFRQSNILVNDKNEASIADFGLSRILETSGFTTKSIAGTSRWMACELIAPEEEDEDHPPELTKATDVWAFAMTVIEVIEPKCHAKSLNKFGRYLRTVFRSHILRSTQPSY